MSMEMIPTVSQNNEFWEGEIYLDFWSAFFDINKVIKLNIGGDKFINAINLFHKKGYEYLIENQKNILNTILNTLFDYYPQMQKEYGYDSIEKSQYMPNLLNKEDFKNILKPHKVYILDVIKNDMPYIGYQFNCLWDDEHGFGVMMHKDRVIQMGGADTSFMSWIAEEDLNM